jgi:hypothetical protein
MREAQFHFSPYRKDAQPIGSDINPWVGISKAGQMVFGSKVLKHYNLANTFAIRLYEDEEKRTIGFTFQKTGSEVDKNTYIIKVKQRGREKYRSDYATVGIKGFLNRIGKVVPPIKRLEIQKYQDSFYGFPIFYITIPKQ